LRAPVSEPHADLANCRIPSSNPFRVCMKTAYALALLFAAVPAVSRAQSNDVDSVSWISGCWIAVQGSTEIEEQWMQPKGDTVIGMSRTVRGSRTTGYEYLMVRPGTDRLIYSAVPSGQVATDFVATAVSNALFRVENPDHDFPQKIEYVAVSDDSLRARVYGNVSDTEPSFVLNYTRTQCH